MPTSASGRPLDATLTDGGEPQRVRALRVTDGTLQALGVQPTRGRWFTEAEHGPAAEGPAPLILSHAFWQRRFGGDEAALGRELSIDAPSGNGTLPSAGPSQVVGIMPPDFRFLDMTPQPDVIIPVRFDPAPAGPWHLPLGNARATQARRYASRGARRPRAHVADLARRLATLPRYARAKLSTTCASHRSFARCRTTWSAVSRACCGCSWARSARCC